MSLYHGVLLVDKEPGCSSHDVVAQVRKIFQTKAVGHCGTLDPMAEGLLVLTLNEATKVSQYILEGDKAYIVRLKLGITTDTLDTTGEILSQNEMRPEAAKVIAEGLGFTGSFEFAVPAYSAVKVAGQPLYAYARKDQEVAAPVKTMSFWGLQHLSQNGDEFEFEIHCSKGSYIRTWVHELGKRLGCGAAMSGLRRIVSSPFEVTTALKLADIASCMKAQTPISGLIPLSRALPHLKKVKIQGLDLKLLRNGQIGSSLRIQLIHAFNPEVDETIQVVSQETGELLALIGLEEKRGFYIRRVLNP